MSACYIGYVVQAIVNNFAPLLFVTFNSSYGIPFDKIGTLITINFGIQLIVDLLSSHFVDKIGYRTSVVAAHALASAGMFLLAFLPDLFSDHYVGILVPLAFLSVGGGLIEVVISPIVEACPCEHKESHMSLLHSFYCWGHVLVVLLSVAFFASAGIENWRYLSIAFAFVPFFNAFVFARVPIRTLEEEKNSESLPLKVLVRKKMFWVMLLMMLGAGASELAVSQWASAFAENGLNISKSAGDLAGPMSFAVLMGLSRVLYSKVGSKVPVENAMLGSGVLCFVSYLIISLSPQPFLSLIGCALCGFSVGVMWPGTYSFASKRLRGGTAMFAVLALAGDLGCSLGPTLVGIIAGGSGENMKLGILAGSFFPILLIIGVIACLRMKKGTENDV